MLVAVCSKCGKVFRDDANFCTGCGVAVDRSAQSGNGEASQSTTVPLIALAPVDKFYSKKNLKRAGIAAGSIVGIVAMVVIVITVIYIFRQNPGAMGSKFNETDVSNDVYSASLALVADVRNDNIKDLMADLINSEGKADDYKFMAKYEQLFKEARGEDPSELEVMFTQCGFMVAYTEFCARKFEYYRDNMLFGGTVADDADRFRVYADRLYEMLLDAESETQLQAIIDYCAENDIIYIK